MKKQIIGCIALIFACATVSINSTAHTMNSNGSMYSNINDTTPAMHHRNSDSGINTRMHKSKNKMMHDSAHSMNNGANSTMDSTHQ